MCHVQDHNHAHDHEIEEVPDFLIMHITVGVGALTSQGNIPDNEGVNMIKNDFGIYLSYLKK